MATPTPIDRSQSRKLTRRNFLATSGTLTAFSVLPLHVALGAGETSPNNKLNIAGIGIGGQGASDLHDVSSENIVALCDVDWDYAGKTFNQYPGAKRYKDFREMLDKEKSIDAVVIAVPDHNHAMVSMAELRLYVAGQTPRSLAALANLRRICQEHPLGKYD